MAATSYAVLPSKREGHGLSNPFLRCFHTGKEEQDQPAEEDHQDVIEQDPTEDLQYEFQESPLTVVYNKVAAIMQQALAETSTKNYAGLLSKCGEFTFPANVKGMTKESSMVI